MAIAKINPKFLTKGQRQILEESKKVPGWMYGLVRREKEQQSRWRKPGTPFYVGQRQVFLPSFRITLLRTPSLPPTTAQFLVPLSLNKLDLRDYLFHAYSIRTHSIRSFIKQAPLTATTPGSWRDLPGHRRRYRPKSAKKMMVELEKPFVWPEETSKEELRGKWDKGRFEKLEGMRERQGRGEYDEVGRERERETIAEQASRLLEGKERWKGLDSVAAETEVGRSFELPVR